MATLHKALQSLGPTDFSSIPTDLSETKEYLQDLFAQAKTIIDSVPPPQTETSSTCSDSTVPAANAVLQKEWSKPIKLGAKENPLGMSVYKLSGKDGRGAWFARRSVHEGTGMGFRKWKLALQSEFPESMEVQGGPGEGNIRGIGGERRVEKIDIDGVGTIEVYHLSAQFPGPTTPRDFVTMLVTSSTALDSTDPDAETTNISNPPRHFIVISKPCIHPECPPRDGFIRGQYESVEFIREIPIKPTKSSSTTDLLRNAQRTLDKGGSGEEMLADMDADGHVPLAKDVLVQEGRKRGKTISFAESRGIRAKGEAMDTRDRAEYNDHAEKNPVEWIMITRSDPGGSVPRFMVERGTPSGIVTDASKFLDWAHKKEHPVQEDYHEQAPDVDQVAAQSMKSSTTLIEEEATPAEPVNQESITSTLASAAMASLESYAPQVVIDRLPGHDSEDTASLSSDSDAASFVSAEDQLEASGPPQSTEPSVKPSPTGDRQERELARFLQRKKTLDERLAQTKEKESKDMEGSTAKEADRIRKAETKHAREVSKHEQRYQKEIAKMEAKRIKEEQKQIEREKKVADKDEKMKLTKERDTARMEVENLKRERELLKDQVGALQRENTALVARVGKLEIGKKVLGEVQAEIESGGRSRSSSLRRKKEGSGVEATVLAKEDGL